MQARLRTAHHRHGSRPLLPAGGFLHRPLAAGADRGDHACPWGPSPPRQRALHSRTSGRGHRPSPAGQRRYRDAGRLRRTLFARHDPVFPCIRPGTSSAPRRCASSMRARSGSCPATTSGSRTRPASLRAARVRRLHQRGHFRAAGVPVAAHAAGRRGDRALVAREPGARHRVGAVLLCARQSPARAGRAARVHRLSPFTCTAPSTH